VLENPPLNLMGPEFVWQIRQIVTTLENDDQLKTSAMRSVFGGHAEKK
jgi:hypothetical protein